jgi:hypothetical protein
VYVVAKSVSDLPDLSSACKAPNMHYVMSFDEEKLSLHALSTLSQVAECG